VAGDGDGRSDRDDAPNALDDTDPGPSEPDPRSDTGARSGGVPRTSTDRHPGGDRETDRGSGSGSGSVEGLGYGPGRPDREPARGDVRCAGDHDVQAVLGALADADCRRILAELDDPGTAPEIAERCDLPRTSAYRKLSTLSEADLLDERIEVREDGHHATRYVRSVSGVFLAYDGGESFSMDVLPDEPRHDGERGESSASVADDRPEAEAGEGDRLDADADPDSREGAESPDERLARYWSRISEEL